MWKVEKRQKEQAQLRIEINERKESLKSDKKVSDLKIQSPPKSKPKSEIQKPKKSSKKKKITEEPTLPAETPDVIEPEIEPKIQEPEIQKSGLEPTPVTPTKPIYDDEKLVKEVLELTKPNQEEDQKD